MTDRARPVDGNRWGEWVRGGAERWEVVRRSWAVFARNTGELLGLLNLPATNHAVALQLMSEDPRSTGQFWEIFDQKLFNQIASVASLVDHTRRLLKYYRPDLPDFVTEYEQRNARVTEMHEAAFLRDLRNYLLHAGVAPVIQTLNLAPTESSDGTGHSIKLSAARLYEWRDWKAPTRAYLSTFADNDGPVLLQVVSAYADAMNALFVGWLFPQRVPLNNEPNIPDRLRLTEDLPG